MKYDDNTVLSCKRFSLLIYNNTLYFKAENIMKTGQRSKIFNLIQLKSTILNLTILKKLQINV